jgi:hypothetical protein
VDWLDCFRALVVSKKLLGGFIRPYVPGR